MPRALVMNHIQRSPLEVGPPLWEMAKIFGVSKVAMKFRLNELCLTYPVCALEKVAEEEFLG